MRGSSHTNRAITNGAHDVPEETINMMRMTSAALRQTFVAVAAMALLAACADEAAVGPDLQPVAGAQLALSEGHAKEVTATLRRATARYHNLKVAIEEGFVLLHECETRPGEGPVGIVYVHMGRLLDGQIDPATPDALIYEPARNGPPKLVGVEFAIPYALWPSQDAPLFHGASFQREDEFGVFALHAWVWRHNPEGLFAESNPRVSCTAVE